MSKIILEPEGPCVIDYGTAPEIVACGLARVDMLGGMTRFALYSDKIVTSEQLPRAVREVVANIILPTESIGASITLTQATLGSRIAVPTDGYAPRTLT